MDVPMTNEERVRDSNGTATKETKEGEAREGPTTNGTGAAAEAAAEAATTPTSEITGEIIEAAEPPARKSQRARVPSVRLIEKEDDNPPPKTSTTATTTTIPSSESKPPPPIATLLTTTTTSPRPPSSSLTSPPPPLPKAVAPPKTSRDLYDRIVESRDRLFFIAYSHDDKHPGGEKAKQQQRGESSKNKTKSAKKSYQWYLVRVDLPTCEQLDDARDCASTGKYYVEFYTKASYDRGVLLPGHPLEEGVTKSSRMKKRADSDSRYWIEWHEYHFDRRDGGMVVGKAKEFLPNGRKEVRRRLRELGRWTRERRGRREGGGENPPEDGGSVAAAIAGNDDDNGGGKGNDGSEEDDQPPTAEFHPDYDRYTAYAEVLDLMDDSTRLVGPFDFDDDVRDIPQPTGLEEDIASLDAKTRALLISEVDGRQRSDLMYIRDRVHRSRWQEVLDLIKKDERGIDPPTISKPPKQKKKKKGGKRAREEPPAAAGIKRPFQFRNDLSVVSKDEIREEIMNVVEETLARTRNATTTAATAKSGKEFYALGEAKEALGRALGDWAAATTSALSSSSPGAKVAVPTAAPSPAIPKKESSETILEGVLEGEFDEKDVESFPAVFAYDRDDPSGMGQENAKIATLDYEVERRRSKAARGGGGHSTSSKGPAATTPHRVASGRELLVPGVPVKGFPAGWISREFARAGLGIKTDTYYYSPVRGYRFRSRKGARRFLEALATTAGRDESVAIESCGGGA